MVGCSYWLPLCETAGSDWRYQPSGTDYRGVGEICPVADRQAGKRDVDRPGDYSLLVIPPRRRPAKRLPKRLLALRDEVADLEAAGIGIIQIDEPALREGLPLRRSDWDAYRKPSASTRRWRRMKLVPHHMCYCEFNDIMDSIAADADVITIETSRSDMELLEFEAFDYPNEIGPGVYDIHSPNVPSVEWIEAPEEGGTAYWHNACGESGLRSENAVGRKPARR